VKGRYQFTVEHDRKQIKHLLGTPPSEGGHENSSPCLDSLLYQFFKFSHRFGVRPMISIAVGGLDKDDISASQRFEFTNDG